MAHLSDMEMVVLGIIFKKGPCTSYAVSREFTHSPTTHFSGSAGAIYPAVTRLLGRKYLRSMESTRGRRPRLTYRVTPKGRTALRKWLTPPLPESAARITYDPIRVRAFFLAVLSTAERRAFVDEAQKKVRDQYPVLEAEMERLEAEGDAFSILAMEGMLHVMEARLNWLSELRKAVSV